MSAHIKYLFFFIILLFFLGSCSKTTGGITGSSSSVVDGLAASSSSAGPAAGGGGGSGNQPGVITAGEWNDIDNWNYWLGLMDSAQWKAKQDYWKFYPQKIYTVIVSDKYGAKISDAQIVLDDAAGNVLWQARTDNAGKAVFFRGLYTNVNSGDYTVRVVIGGKSTNLGSFPASAVIEKQLDISMAAKKDVDVMYVVDATGSMGDELEYLKSELDDVLGKSKSELPGMNLLVGSVFYRDMGDDYLTRSSPFTSNVGTLVDFVRAQSAGGGGDFPEAVHSALKIAVEQQNWSSDAKARLLFLILDAPPHHEDSVIQSLQSTIMLAAQKGIKIIPVTASGIDKDTEFIMRFLAMATNGTYVFITNDSGIGNSHLAPSVGSYKVEFLNNLMLRLIKKYSM